MPELVATSLVVEHREAGVARRALDGVDISVERGDVVAIMGGTGAGKSTLARALVGIQPLAAGSVAGAASGSVRLVLQRPESSFLQERVLDEVMLSARASGATPGDAAARARGLLALLGLPDDVANRDPLALSGGEQRRVAIAAVLAGDPMLTILDEPGAGLDPAAREELHRSLLALRDAGRTIVLITHDPVEAARLGTRLVVLVAGRVAWDGPIEPILGDPRAAERVGLEVAPEVAVLHEVAAMRGVDPGAPTADPATATSRVAELLAAARPALSVAAPPSRLAHPAPLAAPSPRELLERLPRRVDARIRIAACGMAVAAALVASSIAGAVLVAVAAGIVVAAAGISAARVRLAVRPLLGLAVALVALQLIVDPGADAPLLRGSDIDLPAAPALLRGLQAAGVVLATLALSAATAPVDLAAALRWWLAPLRLLRVPVDAAAFIVATGLGLVPVLADELERLRSAQGARGLRPTGATKSPVAALRADAQLLVPLVVGAFRHAHQLADALVLRGIDPEAPVVSWRPRVRPPADVLLLAAGVALLVVSRFA